MNDLTEQYLNGNLHDGDEYYIENKDGEISTMYLYNDTIHWHSFKAKKLKVLAPVPSYEEWEKLNWYAGDGVEENQEIKKENKQLKSEYEKECHRADELEDSYWKAEKENQKLKELLGECLAHLSIGELGTSVTPLNFVIEKIKEVLK